MHNSEDLRLICYSRSLSTRNSVLLCQSQSLMKFESEVTKHAFRDSCIHFHLYPYVSNL